MAVGVGDLFEGKRGVDHGVIITLFEAVEDVSFRTLEDRWKIDHLEQRITAHRQSFRKTEPDGERRRLGIEAAVDEYAALVSDRAAEFRHLRSRHRIENHFRTPAVRDLEDPCREVFLGADDDVRGLLGSDEITLVRAARDRNGNGAQSFGHLYGGNAEAAAIQKRGEAEAEVMRQKAEAFKEVRLFAKPISLCASS